RASHIGDLHTLYGAGCAQHLLDRARRLIPTAARRRRNEQLEQIDRLGESRVDGRKRKRQDGGRNERSAAQKITAGRPGVPFPSDAGSPLSGPLPPRVTKAGELSEVEPLRPRKLARRRASIGPNQMARDWSFVALARLHLLESMGQCADRARQYEQSPAQGWREAELREDDAGGAIDVHPDGSPLLRPNRRLARP